MAEERLWGESQVADAIILEEAFHNNNKKLPQKECVIQLEGNHIVEIEKCRNSIQYFAENYYEITVGVKRELMELWPVQKEALDFLNFG